ncbi:uracil-DNA glycosylase [Roseateles toxinivorans]|uniref:Uracil-DNA glycosylase n=1 Tax=Roseateles toxinivorans TaxID=270368 RepID=A0A4R6QIK1_9BURK|nr:uracil-DNA glycosylase [Roseateles toxinivorans]TDP62432.1 uracil-DNA glycosylase [Roseateles toxinivorans]
MGVQQADLGLDAPNRLSAPLSSLLGGLDAGWQPVVDAWRDSAAGQGLLSHVAARQAQDAVIYPTDPLRALRLTPQAETRVVILGQDPYHGPGQAEGLAFSVPAGLKLPPSLRNIFKELQRDLGQPLPASGHLLAWAQRGVLLLNTCLTVEDGQAASHAKRGWEALTDGLIAAAAEHATPKVFMLWGAHAQSKLGLIAASGRAHLVLQCNHPSPLSATRGPVPFVGCGHFSQAAAFVTAQGGTLAWSL